MGHSSSRAPSDVCEMSTTLELATTAGAIAHHVDTGQAQLAWPRSAGRAEHESTARRAGE
jgi:hypothetical protein